MGFKPTEEQEEIYRTFRQMMEKFDRGNRKLVINAGAGAGKTTTLVQLANIAREFGKEGRFMAFNTAIVESAAAKMPANVKCSTFHAYFYGTTGRFYQHRSDKVSAVRTAEVLGIKEDIELSEKILTPVMQARIIYRAINKYSMSDDYNIADYHIQYVRGVTDDDMVILRSELYPFLVKAWKDVASIDGVLRFKPENYIKIGALKAPRIKGSFVFVDEAQDTFPVILGWLKRQPHLRLIITGDSAQAINEWTGAVNSMKLWHGWDKENGCLKNDVVYKTLKQSFRFNQELADEANRWLYIENGGEFFIKGSDFRTTVVADTNQGIPDLVLCATNAGVIRAAMHYVAQGIQTSMSKRNMEDIKRIGQAAMQLMAGTSCDHEDFAAFQNWDEVLEYVENDPGGSDIKTMVKLVDKLGPDALLNLSDSLVPENMAQTVIRTVWTAKGLEANGVEIWNDFTPPQPKGDEPEPEDWDIADVRVAYVAITRAMEWLNRGSLACIDDYVVFED